jgi:hypothetical protein
MRVIAGMATYRGRERCIIEALNSLVNQVDEIHVYVNDATRVNYTHEKVYIHRFPLGDIGDRGKFYLPTRGDIYLTVDDDLIYPKDYVQKCIEGINKHNTAVTFHGRNLLPNAASYYKGAKERFRCLDRVASDVPVQFPGTGVMAWRHGEVNFDLGRFKESNMADVFSGIELFRQGKKAVCLAHPKGWIQHSKQIAISETIGGKIGKEKNQMFYINQIGML